MTNLTEPPEQTTREKAVALVRRLTEYNQQIDTLTKKRDALICQLYATDKELADRLSVALREKLGDDPTDILCTMLGLIAKEDDSDGVFRALLNWIKRR